MNQGIHLSKLSQHCLFTDRQGISGWLRTFTATASWESLTREMPGTEFRTFCTQSMCWNPELWIADWSFLWFKSRVELRRQVKFQMQAKDREGGVFPLIDPWWFALLSCCPPSITDKINLLFQSQQGNAICLCIGRKGWLWDGKQWVWNKIVKLKGFFF